MQDGVGEFAGRACLRKRCLSFLHASVYVSSIFSPASECTYSRLLRGPSDGVSLWTEMRVARHHPRLEFESTRAAVRIRRMKRTIEVRELFGTFFFLLYF